MAPPTRTDTLDNLFTTTLRLRKKKAENNVFSACPFYYLMTKKGRIEDASGGISHEEPIEYAKNTPGEWISRGGTVSLDDDEFLTMANYTLKYFAVNINRYMVDEAQNMGAAKVMSYVTKKLDNAESTMIDTIETALFTAQTGKAPNGLPDLAAEDPTSGTVGGLNAATHSWWRNQCRDMTGYAAVTYLRSWMENMYNRCSKLGQITQASPDIIVTDQTVYELYNDEVFEIAWGYIDDAKLKDIGLGNLSFKGKPLTWSPALSTALGRMYFLNSSAIRIVRNPSLWFTMTDWKSIPNQTNDKVAQEILSMELATGCRAKSGVLFDISSDGSM
jgi:hypothetical protein